MLISILFAHVNHIVLVSLLKMSTVQNTRALCDVSFKEDSDVVFTISNGSSRNIVMFCRYGSVTYFGGERRIERCSVDDRKICRRLIMFWNTRAIMNINGLEKLKHFYPKHVSAHPSYAHASVALPIVALV